MINKIKNFASLYRQLGFRWSVFRLTYAFRLRTGLIRLQTPQYKWESRPLDTWLKKNIPSDSESYAQYRKNNLPKFFFDSEKYRKIYLAFNKSDINVAVHEADKILSGEIKYFSHQFHKTGFPPNWHDVTLSASEGSLLISSEILRFAQNDMGKHWSQISDDYVVARRALALPDEAIPNYEETASAKNKNASQRHADIKFIWEPNRFAFVYTLVRAYAATQDEKYAQAFWTLIEDWAQHNPPNTGANWKDGQETALRLMAWTFGYYAFIHSPLTTPERISQFTQLVAAQAERIHKNIDYAISTKSNHTISEGFGLWMVGLLFPELKDSEKYFSLGKKILEEEIEQIFPDGSYAMYSLNYHRFILHIYLYAIRLGELNQDNPSWRAAHVAAKQSQIWYTRLLRREVHTPRNDGNEIGFSDSLKQSISNSINYLANLIDFETGQIPFYGSNDGALVLPLNNCDFTDFRPLLQLGSVITKGERLFDSDAWDEDLFWLCEEQLTAKSAKNAKNAKNAKEKLNLSDLSVLRGDSFPDGGIYILRNTNSKAIIRCTDYKSRPSHADQMHVDLWIHGQNIACDAGTYLYSGEGVWRNGLAHTLVHNTVIVDNKDQMNMVSRFTWTNWSKGKVLQQNEKLWQGEHDSYKPVSHKRTIISLEGDRWLVIDKLNANVSHDFALHWLLNDFPYEQKLNSILLSLDSIKYKMQLGVLNGKADLSIIRADENSTRGWRSRYYGHKEPAISVLLEANQREVTFWSFFGFENDKFEITEKIFRLNKIEINLLTDN